jgi:hypothetical protein
LPPARDHTIRTSSARNPITRHPLHGLLIADALDEFLLLLPAPFRRAEAAVVNLVIGGFLG